MLLRVILSASLAYGFAAASEVPLNLLGNSPNSLQACTQTALQNAINAGRQKKLAKENLAKKGVDYAHVLGAEPARKIIIRAQAKMPACSIPLTQGRLSAGTRFELNKIYPPSRSFDSTMNHSGLPVCR